MIKRLLLAAMTTALGLMTTAPVRAQTYPDRPIKVIVPFAAGGTTDVVGRVIGAKLAELLGQPVVIDNRGGAGTIIGTGALAKSAPDGYTIMLTTPDFTINPSLHSQLPYQTPADFTAISLFATYPLVLVVNAKQGITSVKDLIAKARANPGQINYASGGNGSIQHLCTAMLANMARLNITHIPYKGGGPAITDLLAGRVSLLCTGAPPVEAYVKSGKLRILAVSTAQRHPAMPDVASIAESGVPGYDVQAWLGFIGPAGMPKVVVEKLNAAIAETMRDPTVRKNLSILGADLRASTPQAFDTLIRNEIAKWRQVIQSAGIVTQ